MKNKLLFIAVLLCIESFFSNGALAQIGVLRSNLSANYSCDKYLLLNHSKKWNEIINNINYTNIKYQIIDENKANNENLKKYNLVILPLIYNLPPEIYANLKDYVQNGGKIIIFFSDSQVLADANKLLDLIGIKMDGSKRIMSKVSMFWVNGNKISNNDIPVTTKIADISLAKNVSIIGTWKNNDENYPAIGLSANGGYISWRWGNDGNLSFNSEVLKNVMENLYPGIIAKEQTPIEYKIYKNKVAEINRYRENTSNFIEMRHKQTLEPILAEIQEHLYLSQLQQKLSKLYYENGNYHKSLEELKESKDNALLAYAKSAPSSTIEGRTLWLDRGTITSIKSQKQMGKLFDKIKNIGINLIYFETINAGYAIYPSKILRQNPQTVGTNPLKWAVEEAHKRNLELHAWTWIFAAGNERLNSIIGQNAGYPGPILSKNKEFTLAAKNGSFLIPGQHEYWIDPSNPSAREHIISALEEIVKTYKVDGIQFDYIRYPFQSKNTLMGYNPDAKKRFEIESGLKLDNLNSNTLKAWNEWKSKQVSKFVQRASFKLRKINPNLLISAAVFGGDRSKRLSSIQQDWELWVNNGWIDTLNPMIYASSSDKLLKNIEYFIKTVENKAIIYPGIAVRKIDTSDMLDQIYMTKNKGLVGSTIFAMAHLCSEKSELLSIGPYKLKQARVPYKEPLRNSQILLEEFVSKLKELNPSTVNAYWINNIIAEADKVHSSFAKTIKKPTLTNIDKTLTDLKALETYVRNTLSLDLKLDKTKINILTSYLFQSITLVSYSQHKQLINAPKTVTSSCPSTTLFK